MRNGLNIASVSELVHEIRTVPEEALVRLGARVSPLGPGCAQATSTGSRRSAFPFRRPCPAVRPNAVSMASSAWPGAARFHAERLFKNVRAAWTQTRLDGRFG